MTTPRPDSTPIPERSLNRQLVLEEDEYTAALSHIIARDFFPSLVQLDATNEYLDAVSSQDPARIQASVRRMQDIQDTPHFVGDTPRSERGERPSKRARYDRELSLDNFQARYTSEDNSSFTQILDEENRQRKERWGWAWDAQMRVEAVQTKMIEGRERMLVEGPVATGVRERFLIEAPQPLGLITAGEEEDEDKRDESSVKALVMFGEETALVPASQPESDSDVVDVMAPKKDTRSAGVDGWKFKARNTLMFPPDADISPFTNPSAMNDPKSIKHSATRVVVEQSQSSAMEPPSPTPSRINAAIAGVPYRPQTDDTQAYVPDVPSHTASDIGPSGVKQLMTWGSLNATPRIISQTDDPAGLPASSTPFHLPAVTSREAISHRLSNNASKSLRAKAGLLAGKTPLLQTPKTTKGSNMAPPSWTPRRADAPGNLTPAARRLLSRSTVGGASSNWASKSSKNLDKARWTPTPGR